jgi:guanylate kinase
MLDSKIFFESTMYADHGYGSKKDDVDKILAKGKSVLATMDICGAMALKS